ncbi:galactose-3-O-sulfotransferase 2-like [Gastrophryne carolinensis]
MNEYDKYVINQLEKNNQNQTNVNLGTSTVLKFKYIPFVLLGLLFIVLQFFVIIYNWSENHSIKFAISYSSWLKDLELTEDTPGELIKSIQQQYNNHSCKPLTNIFFLKTHKTASSSIINILFRYGDYHNLTFALPFKNDHQFLYPNYFQAKYVDGFSSQKQQTFNIMCNHMRFQLTEVVKVMPQDTFYFTILRNPVSLMESAFAYYKSKYLFMNADNLEQFLSNAGSRNNGDKVYSGFTKNFMTFDFGFDNNGPESLKYFQFISHVVTNVFNLVLITEYFDESLVLLKDALCWTLDDVLSFPLNVRNSSKLDLSFEARDKIKRWNQLDWQLYIYLNNTFWDRVDRFGRKRMQFEVEKIRRRREEIMEKCIENQADPRKIKDKSLIPYQPELKILGYNLRTGLDKADQDLCYRLVLPEVQYTKLLSTKQRDKLIKRRINSLYRKYL